jgi:hypothetical protein
MASSSTFHVFSARVTRGLVCCQTEQAERGRRAGATVPPTWVVRVHADRVPERLYPNLRTAGRSAARTVAPEASKAIAGFTAALVAAGALAPGTATIASDQQRVARPVAPQGHPPSASGSCCCCGESLASIHAPRAGAGAPRRRREAGRGPLGRLSNLSARPLGLPCPREDPRRAACRGARATHAALFSAGKSIGYSAERQELTRAELRTSTLGPAVGSVRLRGGRIRGRQGVRRRSHAIDSNPVQLYSRLARGFR